MGRHTLEYPKEAVNTVRRLNDQGVYSLSTIHGIINTCQMLHVSFQTPNQPFPAILPMIGQMGSFARPSADIGDPLDLYLHGYVSARIMNTPCTGGEEGIPMSIAASHVDGLVLAMSGFSHSYNYRSAVLFGYATVVEDEEERLYALELITDKVVPDRWRHTRLPPTKGELQSTSILKVKIASGSAKIRTGDPHDDKHDLENEELRKDIWSGVLPIYQTMGEPVPSSYNRAEVPDHIKEFSQDFNADNKEHVLESAKGKK